MERHSERGLGTDSIGHDNIFFVGRATQLITLQPLIGGVCFKRFLSQSLLIKDNHQSNPEMIFNKKDLSF